MKKDEHTQDSRPTWALPDTINSYADSFEAFTHAIKRASFSFLSAVRWIVELFRLLPNGL